MIFGIDCASTVNDTARLKAAGVEFVCRYVSPPGNAKNISRAEAARIVKAGLDLVLVWETNGDEPLHGLNQGVQDARLAAAEAHAAGAPANSALYFAFDRDPNGLTADQWRSINAYFKGVASVIGTKHTGAYGGYEFVKHLFDKKLITYGWQTYAWSGGHWDLRAQLRQYLNGQSLGGIGVDFDHATHADFGQWGGSAPVREIHHWNIRYRNANGQISHRAVKHPRRWAFRYKGPFLHGDVVFHRVFK